MKNVNPTTKASSIIIIMIILFLYFIIAIAAVMPKYKQKIYDNWSEYKCNPLIIPMASFYNPSVSTGENFNTCLTQMQLIFFKILLGPLYSLLGMIQNVMKTMLESFDSLRNFISLIRSRVQQILMTIIQKIETLELGLRQFLIRLKSSIGKMEGVMITTEYTFIVISMALEWIFNVPGIIALVTIILLIILAVMICFFFPFVCAVLAVLAAGVGIAYCFDEDTLIKLENGQSRKISELKINDQLYLGGKVTGIIKARHNHDVYNYHGILVSGEHLVLENKKWTKVKNCSTSQKVSYSKEYLYCLTTENNQIVTHNNIIFRDFDETNSPHLNCIINNLIINNLNNQSSIKTVPRHLQVDLEIMPCGFSGNTLIETPYGKKYINELVIGDTLSNSSTIVSIIKMSSQNIQMFNYQGLTVSGSNPIFENGTWIRVYESKQAKLIEFKEKYLYHLGTDSQEVLINNCKFRDFLEIPQGRLSENIDSCIINYLNNTNV